LGNWKYLSPLVQAHQIRTARQQQQSNTTTTAMMIHRVVLLFFLVVAEAEAGVVEVPVVPETGGVKEDGGM